MDAHDESVPRRRSFLPGAEDAENVSMGSDASDASGGDPHGQEQPPEVDDDGMPTEVFARWQQDSAAAWYRNKWVLVAAASAVVVGVGVGIAIAMNSGSGEVAAASPSASPSESASPSPSPSAAPTSVLDDGIAEDEYPASAPSMGENYPAALVMEDWVWDKAGPLWTLVAVSPFETSTTEPSTTVLYLASPEGVLFDVVHLVLPSGETRVVSWLEDTRQARIETLSSYEGTADGRLVDLTTGEVQEASFSMSSGVSAWEQSVGASASGPELWVATDGTYTESRFQWWTAAGGWQRVSGDADIMPWNVVVSPSGELAAAEIYGRDASGYASARSGAPGQPRIVVFDVANLSTSVVTPVYPTSTGWCSLASITDEGVPIVGCYNDTPRRFLAYDGKEMVEADDSAVPLHVAITEAASYVDKENGLRFVSRANDSSAYEVQVDDNGEWITLLEAGDELPYSGIPSPTATTATEGVVLLRGGGVCALVDVENAAVSVITALDIRGVVSCIGYGVGSGPRIQSSYYYD